MQWCNSYMFTLFIYLVCQLIRQMFFCFLSYGDHLLIFVIFLYSLPTPRIIKYVCTHVSVSFSPDSLTAVWYLFSLGNANSLREYFQNSQFFANSSHTKCLQNDVFNALMCPQFKQYVSKLSKRTYFSGMPE